MTNDLSELINDFIASKGIRKSFIAEKLDISPQYLYKLLSKKNFTIEDANRILSTIDCEIDISIKQKTNKKV